MRVQKKTKHLPIDSIDHSHNSVCFVFKSVENDISYVNSNFHMETISSKRPKEISTISEMALSKRLFPYENLNSHIYKNQNFGTVCHTKVCLTFFEVKNF